MTNPLPSESGTVFYSSTSHLFDFINNYKSVHADEGFNGAWRKKKQAGGPILTNNVFWVQR
ncbi:hypothetical protein K435DRAFT_305668 [Dendrothele bispora CBS 962.96]|uniref:Uncharacterized protein n=1 Tax=Dendrothele bispora (strain CBS 962.96) TaxID=1314807 RepID=A0A4S8LJA8_DENBC|nr:hypothetical protein K435DRAFT_305668 [Dendrothele bispora CBS 962.96]